MTRDETITLLRAHAQGGNAKVVIPRSIGPIRLIREIGVGGMGVVWLGHDDNLGRDVAVKFLINVVPGSDEASFGRLFDGVRAAAKVQHANLVTIHHADLIGEAPYVVMEYVEGLTLRQIVSKIGPLDADTTLDLVAPIAAAVAELHAHGIIHRDIKPGNVLLDTDGRIRVTDFGLTVARPAGSSGRTSAGVAGTPAYMAPEVFDGIVSLQSDVYALGITTCELLLGSPPFAGSFTQLRDQHQGDGLPLEELRSRRIDQAILELLERATHKQAIYRFKTAEHFLRAAEVAGAKDLGSRKTRLRLGRLLERCRPADGAASDSEPLPATPESYHDRLSTIARQKRLSSAKQTSQSAARVQGVDRTPTSGSGQANRDDDPAPRVTSLWRRGLVATVVFWLLPVPLFLAGSLVRSIETGSLAKTIALACLSPIVPLAVIWTYHRMTFRCFVPDGHTRCGLCGYILKGIVEPRCPECGARL